jgi:SHS2 domain-containing protein
VSPFQEIDHTADWALEVWAPTLEGLFVDAARGMYHLAGAEPAAATAPGEPRLLELAADDAEALLVAWLQELLYLSETEGLVFDDLTLLALTPTHLRAEARGRPTAQPGKAIKAVTFHNLSIRREDGRYRVVIVFDV